MYSCKKLTLLFIFILGSSWAKSIQYTVSMPEPHTHLFEVEMRLDGAGSKEIVALPVWTPGSYLIREYAKNVQDVSARSERGSTLDIVKLDKNHWQIRGKRGEDMIISYKVYAFEHSVRTSYLNADHALIVPASVLMYWQGNEGRAHHLNINLPETWSTITTALQPFNQGGNTRFTAADYDELVDSPLELGNHHEIQFEVLGVPHVIGIYVASNYVDSVLVRDFSKIMEAEAGLFGGLPYDRYAFIIHAEEGRGGLEHSTSSVNFISRWSFNDEKRYHSFLALIAHEYFHLWNVKRLAPAGVASFDYDQENYLDELWVAEGFTSYYDELILYRVGLSTQDKYLSILASEINDLEERPGRLHQSVAAASFDSWIKYYRPNEHSQNSTISYYNKGHLLAWLLDLKIIQATGGKSCLDDVMRLLYRNFPLKKGGYTSSDVQKACERVSGLDLNGFFKDYVYGVEELPYASILDMAGLVMDSTKTKQSWIGAKLRNQGGRIEISSVLEDSPAWEGGLNVNDELIALDGFRVESTSPSYLREKIPGDRIVCTVSRNGVLTDLQLTVGFAPPSIKAILRTENPSESQDQVFLKWMELYTGNETGNP